MSLEDRDWYRDARDRQATGGTKSGPTKGAPRSDFERLLHRQAGESGMPWWVREGVRLAIFFGVLTVLYLGWKYLVG